MAYALQLTFDPDTDAMVRGLWRRFAQMHMTHHLSESANRPHVTLAVYAELDLVLAESTLSHLARCHGRLPLTFSHIGCFVRPSAVAFLAPIVTVDLLSLHRRACETFAKVGREPVGLYVPGQWVPHCTIAMHMEDRVLPEVIEVGQEIHLPWTGFVTGVAVVEVSPTVPLFAADLDGRGSSD